MAMEVLQSGGVKEQVEFTPCSICGRTFNPEVLARHERVCTKNQKQANKRPVFDTAKKRMQGTDLQSFLASRPYLKHKQPSSADIKAAERKKNWKRKHEDFINSIRSVKDYTDAEAAGKSVRPPIPSQPNPDYVQCPYCARRFEEYSAERHIPFCKEKNNRIERRSYQGNKAMEKLNKRIQYKPPKLRKKTSDQDTPTSKLSSNPPGYHLVARKSNFSGTYNLDDEPGSPERRSSYQPSYHREVRVRGGGGGPVVRGSVSKTSVHRAGTISHTSATSAGDLPGNPWMRGHDENVLGGTEEGEQDDKLIRRRRSQLKTPQPVANARGREGGVRRARQIRGISENDGGEGGGGGGHYSSSSSFGGDGADGFKLGPVKPKAKSKGLRVRAEESPPPPPPHEDMRFDHSTGFNGGLARGDTRSGSGSSIGGRRGVPLNQHGMAMGKFCYECGAKYPVPQAKYCCECGTKRI